MLYPGLVSISFRAHNPEEILLAMKPLGLCCIEWGSDVHAPANDAQRLEDLRAMQERFGIFCCSYGTYFRLGHTPLDELPQYFQAAKILGTRILRLWCGRKKAPDCTDEEKEYLLDQCRRAAAMARDAGVILCLECHRRSYTETPEGALELMEAVNSPHFRMYWQPDPDISMEDNIRYIRLLQPYITHLHVFHWQGTEKLPLKEGLCHWRGYLSALEGTHHLLLEFMPNDQLATLPQESAALQALIENSR